MNISVILIYLDETSKQILTCIGFVIVGIGLVLSYLYFRNFHKLKEPKELNKQNK